ncbi:MAG: tetratricopeptide repeat protein [Deltaproteobacteria bacterium]|nr:tetratricopeptide repeat protein [Deltaproteobacteria bacterium]
MSDSRSNHGGIAAWLVALVILVGVLVPVGAWAWLTLFDYKDASGISASHEAIGDQAYSAGDFREAITAYEQAASVKNSFAIQVKLAGVRIGLLGLHPDMLDQRQFPRIEHERRWLMEQDPASIPTCIAVRGHMEMIEGKLKQAEASYNESLKKNADNVAAHMGLALLDKQKGDDDEAAGEFETVLAAVPDHYEALVALSEIRINNGKPEKALELLKKAVKTNNTWRPHYLMGVAYEKSKKDEKAEKEFKQAIQLNPKSFVTYAALGNLYFKAKMYAQAKSAFSGALQLRNDEGIAAGLASSLKELSRPAECLKTLKPYIGSSEIGPGTLLVAGQCSADLKQTGQARALYSAVIAQVAKLGDKLPKDVGEALNQAARKSLAELEGESKAGSKGRSR